MTRCRLALIALVILLSLPSGLALQPATGSASGDQSASHTDAASAPTRLKATKAEPSGERAGEHTRNHKRGRHHDRHQRGPTKRERKKHWKEHCTGPGAVQLPKSRSCTHGGDPAPPGVSIAHDAEPVSPSQAQLAAADVICDGDGQGGSRFQVLYVHAADVASRYDAFLASFRTWAAEADTAMRQSAEEVDGSRRFRFVTMGSCEIDVIPVQIPAGADDSFDDTIDALLDQGYDDTNRKYLLFADTNLDGVCGIAEFWADDRPIQSNWNNFGPSFAQVYADCWDDSDSAAHEMMHTLGGVQDSAPHATDFGHCIDEWDVMCYRDDGSTPRMQYLCTNFSHDALYDCHHDDYFHPAPAGGSYLATHWNTADNQFLVGNGLLQLTAPKSGAKVKPKRALTVVAAPSSGLSDVESVELRFCEGNRCGWDAGKPLATDSSAPFQATWIAPKKGTFTFRALATTADAGPAFADPVVVTVNKKKQKKKH